MAELGGEPLQEPPAQVLSWEAAVLALRADPTRSGLVRDAYYDDPLTEAAHRYWCSDEWRAIVDLLPTPHRGLALDVGAGRGIASYALAKEGFQVRALEPDPSAVVGAEAIRELARITGLPIQVEQEVSEHLPYADSGFDLVFARAVLHHTQDLGAACREFFRVLRPGGCLVAVREHVISRQEDLPEFLQIHPLHRFYGGENAFLLSQYKNALQEAGFQLRKVLAPLSSPVNYAPHTRASLQAEVVRRICGDSSAAGSALAAMLRVPIAWAAVLPLLQMRDHRPGRLYSFLARKP